MEDTDLLRKMDNLFFLVIIKRYAISKMGLQKYGRIIYGDWLMNKEK